MTAKTMLRLAPLFAGCDAGHYTLPTELLTARAAVQRLRAAAPAEPTTPAQAHQKYLHSLVAAARAGEDMPSATGYRRAANHHADWQAFCVALHEAVALAESDLVVSDDIITEHLRPALGEVQRDLARLGAILPADASDGFLASVSATQQARRAWSELEHLAARYSAIRRAYDIVLGYVQHEDAGEWAWAENLQQLWPTWRVLLGYAPGNNAAPWPTDPRQRLLWLHHHGAQLVVLTAAERSAKFKAKYGEAMAEQRQSGLDAVAFGALMP